jgi:hypothetical protein
MAEFRGWVFEARRVEDPEEGEKLRGERDKRRERDQAIAAKALLESALKTRGRVDLQKIATAVKTCRTIVELGQIDLDLQLKAEQKLREELERALGEAVADLDNKRLQQTWNELYRHLELARQLGFVDLPSFREGLRRKTELNLSFDDVMDLEKTEMGLDAKKFFNQVFQSCRNKDFDDMMDLPRIEVERVVQVRNEQTTAEYLLRRARLVQDLLKNPCEQVRVKSQAGLQWGKSLGMRDLDEAFNEFYLFHGTTREVSEKICDTDFFINENARHGKTFGSGVYLAEYLSHAQFFATLEEKDPPVIIVCRAFCGRVQQVKELHHNTAQEHPQRQQFEAALRNGTFHSTSGFEWPGARDLREFVLPDDDQVLPEFLVYTRYAS